MDATGLTEEQAQFRQSVNEFAQREVAPLAEETDKKNEFPMVLFRHKLH